MFVYLRYFYLASIILVIVASFFIGSSIRSMTADVMAELLKEHDEALANQYITNIWESRYPRNLEPGPERYHRMEDFRIRSLAFTEKQPKLRFTIYDSNGRSIFNSKDVQISDSSGAEIGSFRDKMTDSESSHNRVLENVSYNGQEHIVIQSLIPIKNSSYDPTSPQCPAQGKLVPNLPDLCYPTFGVIEVVSDISAQWDMLSEIQIITSGSISGIFILLISILFVTTQRAEGIIAKQHEANMELINAASSAEADSRDKSQFLANISHELRTPLNAIIGFSEIIRKEGMQDLSPTHQEYIRDINSSGSHLLSLINDILDFSKAEAGKLELDSTEVDLSKLLINSMRLVIPRAEEAQVTLVEDMPAEHIVCTTDAKKLKQVILNLLSNAVKFTNAGGEVKLTAWHMLANNSVHIVVKDSGIGIAPKDIAKVMTPFGQVESNLSRRYEGTGLGLPLSKKFVEIMGGTFTIESEVDVGTTITIVLPGEPPQPTHPAA